MEVCNKSTRHGQKPILIVVHDTEGGNVQGSKDLRGVGNWFDNSNSQASAHVCTDAEGQSARYVFDDDKAWACAYYNAPSLSIEQIGFANQTHWPHAQIEETARWIALWSHRHDIPIRKGVVSRDGRVIKRGVIRHSDLGNLGGGHHDPGPHFPLANCLVIARKIARRGY
jgi:N-acetyl-anhydromuramyl-L-alanine amidase AmpD